MPRIRFDILLFLQLGILFDCAEEIALALVGQRAKALTVADTFQRKAVLFQSGADGVEVVGVLAELLVEVLPRLAVVAIEKAEKLVMHKINVD